MKNGKYDAVDLTQPTVSNPGEDVVSNELRNVERAIEYSLQESEYNKRARLHNTTAKTEDIIPYENNALLELISAVKKVLSNSC